MLVQVCSLFLVSNYQVFPTIFRLPLGQTHFQVESLSYKSAILKYIKKASSSVNSPLWYIQLNQSIIYSTSSFLLNVKHTRLIGMILHR